MILGVVDGFDCCSPEGIQIFGFFGFVHEFTNCILNLFLNLFLTLYLICVIIQSKMEI